jgi:hypothetical protein
MIKIIIINDNNTSEMHLIEFRHRQQVIGQHDLDLKYSTHLLIVIFLLLFFLLKNAIMKIMIVIYIIKNKPYTHLFFFFFTQRFTHQA